MGNRKGDKIAGDTDETVFDFIGFGAVSLLLYITVLVAGGTRLQERGNKH